MRRLGAAIAALLAIAACERQAPESAAAARPPKCTKADAAVTLTKFYDESRMYFAVMGELVNRCHEPLGIHVRIVGYDKGGKMLDMWEGWPASIRNIAPQGREPFKMTIFQFDPAIKKIDAEVIEVRRWRQ